MRTATTAVKSPIAGGESPAGKLTPSGIDAIPKAMASGRAMMPTVIPASTSESAPLRSIPFAKTDDRFGEIACHWNK